ncbi:MAG: hypothetical protein IJX17_03435 [Clostridia bacterium]|nr:hypothetical protein [Clostridia bacterium]
MIKNLTGTIKNLKLEVKHNNLEIIKNTAFFAEISSGIIKNCEISGYINGEFKNSEDSYLSMFVNQNDGTIENSIANISAEITNSSSTNAFLSSFSSVNNGKIVACKSTNLSYLVDTIDLACFAIDNNGSIEKCENNLELSQTSSSLWHPNTAGICIDNNGTIKDTANNGDISSSSTNTTSSNEQNDRFVIYASGCSISNNGTVSNVINNGKISATSLVAETYSSGIIVHNNKELVDVTNNGDIFASSDSSNIYVSGITCYNSFTYKITEQGLMSYFEFINTSSILRATNNGNIEATSKIEIENNQTIISNIGVYAGGISAYNFTHIDSSINNGDIKCDSKSATIYAGGLTGYANYHSSFSPHLTYVISNSVSKSTISVTSSLSVTFVGGVTGYGVQTKIIKSGFEGKMTTNAVESYAGGIAGSYKAPDSIYSNNATISDCYASVSFDNQAVKSFYGAGIVGFYNTVYNIYASNNAYYSGADVPSMYLVDLNTGELTGYGAEDTGATKFNSHQELLNFIYGEAK